MHVVKGIFASSSDVDHGVEGGKKELGGVGAALRVDGRKGAGGDGTGPYLVLKTFGVAAWPGWSAGCRGVRRSGVGGHRRTRGRPDGVGVGSRVEGDRDDGRRRRWRWPLRR